MEEYEMVDFRQFRGGGSWFRDSGLCRLARRYGSPPIVRYINVGFRAVRAPRALTRHREKTGEAMAAKITFRRGGF